MAATVLMLRSAVAAGFLAVQVAPAFSQGPAESAPALEGRLAIVIGVSDYQHAPDLENPGRDAALVSDTLEGLGFEVMTVTDVTRDGFDETLDAAVAAADGKEAVLFYFAGHGFQLGGRNFLVPADAELTDRARIPEETISLDSVIARLEDKSRQTLILLDACRNNPVPASAAGEMNGEGLAQIETGSGTFVAFATQPGNITRDGAGDNSPFARALADNMVVEGISISDMMIRVRNQVEEATFAKQTPWDQSSLRSQFYFNLAEENSDSLTAEDLALLDQLDPELREKFKKKFGLALDDEAENASQTDNTVVAKVTPSLKIESVTAGPEPVSGEDTGEERPATPSIATTARPDLASTPQAPDDGNAAASEPSSTPKPKLQILAVAPEEGSALERQSATVAESPQASHPAKQSNTDVASVPEAGAEPQVEAGGETDSAVGPDDGPVQDQAPAGVARPSPIVPTAASPLIAAAVADAPIDTGSPVPVLPQIPPSLPGPLVAAVSPLVGTEALPAARSGAPARDDEAVEQLASVPQQPPMIEGPAALVPSLIPVPSPLDSGSLAAKGDRPVSAATKGPQTGNPPTVLPPKVLPPTVLPPTVLPPAVPAEPQIQVAAIEPEAASGSVEPVLERGFPKAEAAQPPVAADIAPALASAPAPAAARAPNPASAHAAGQDNGSGTDVKNERTAPTLTPVEDLGLSVAVAPAPVARPTVSPPGGSAAQPAAPVQVASLPGDLQFPIGALAPEPLSQGELAKRAQSELFRLGCYRSAIDGDWGPKSARAVLRFYAEQKLDPEDVEPTQALLDRLTSVDTVVCKTTEADAKPKADTPKSGTKKASGEKPKKQPAAQPPKPRAPKPQPPKPQVKKTAPKPPAVKPAAPGGKKKLTTKRIIGVFR
ncbi:MAG: caspase family protein [Rhizobiaceae bacterium]|jgi:hypothetical protein|nr:caspase family protein [Rhizobiaceae bacterium]